MEAGAKQGTSPADVVQHCDIIFSCVSDANAVRDVSISFLILFLLDQNGLLNSSNGLLEFIKINRYIMFCQTLQLVIGNTGVLQGISAGKGYIEMSTVDSDTIKEISEVKNFICV